MLIASTRYKYVNFCVLTTDKIKLTVLLGTDIVTTAVKHFQVVAERSTFHLKPAIFRHLEV
ncbi:hypothetical protein yberc0001_450 [Yersinia bercovieri ATCC 43970]|uniref:Uncharacterized protein n=1 Tax=Yersinia bercovieri ATCC 43970 TaxID=349968 RepID=A0ABP2EAA8_YERBE|nr:hypothetical protein yberc0001_450 [Yersinia bercovieri ATCC 43970]